MEHAKNVEDAAEVYRHLGTSAISSRKGLALPHLATDQWRATRYELPLLVLQAPDSNASWPAGRADLSRSCIASICRAYYPRLTLSGDIANPTIRSPFISDDFVVKPSTCTANDAAQQACQVNSTMNRCKGISQQPVSFVANFNRQTKGQYPAALT